jgi:hypothetical protein
VIGIDVSKLDWIVLDDFHIEGYTSWAAGSVLFRKGNLHGGCLILGGCIIRHSPIRNISLAHSAVQFQILQVRCKTLVQHNKLSSFDYEAETAAFSQSDRCECVFGALYIKT